MSDNSEIEHDHEVAVARYVAKEDAGSGEGSGSSREEHLELRLRLLKREWLEAKDCLGRELASVANRELEKRQIENAWLGEYGDEYLDMMCQHGLLVRARQRLQLKESEPTLNRSELDTRLEASLADASAEADELHFKVLVANQKMLATRDGPVADPAEIAKWQEDRKRICRRIWMVVHDDLNQNKQMSEKEGQYFKSVQHWLSQIDSTELNCQPYHVGWDSRSPASLQEVLFTVERIARGSGGSVITDEDIIPEAPAEAERFLREDLEDLRAGIEQAHAAHVRLLADPDTRERRLQLAAAPDQQRRIRGLLGRKAREYEGEAGQLDKELADLFGEKVVA